MPQTEKPLVQPVDLSQNAGINVVNLGADDTLQGRLEVQGDLKIAGKVDGELRATGNITIDSSASVQASIEGSNVSVRGQVTGTVTARRRLTLGGSGRLSGDVKVGRLNVEDGTTLNVAMPTGSKITSKGGDRVVMEVPRLFDGVATHTRAPRR